MFSPLLIAAMSRTRICGVHRIASRTSGGTYRGAAGWIGDRHASTNRLTSMYRNAKPFHPRARRGEQPAAFHLHLAGSALAQNIRRQRRHYRQGVGRCHRHEGRKTEADSRHCPLGRRDQHQRHRRTFISDGAANARDLDFTSRCFTVYRTHAKMRTLLQDSDQSENRRDDLDRSRPCPARQPVRRRRIPTVRSGRDGKIGLCSRTQTLEHDVCCPDQEIDLAIASAYAAFTTSPDCAQMPMRAVTHHQR